MPRNKTTWKNTEAGGTKVNATNLNNTYGNAYDGATFADTATATGKAVITATDQAAARAAIGAWTAWLHNGSDLPKTANEGDVLKC